MEYKYFTCDLNPLLKEWANDNLKNFKNAFVQEVFIDTAQDKLIFKWCDTRNPMWEDD